MNDASPSSPHDASGAVVLRYADVEKRFGPTTALDGVSLAIEPGQFVVVLGPSGAGKSTLLRTTNRLSDPDSGTVHLFGQDVGSLSGTSLRELRRRVAFIFQDFGLVERLTALENVLTGGLGRLRLPRYGALTYPRHMRERALELLDRVGLEKQAYQRCDTLSGGQKQRVGVARALMQEPDLVLADEPVASLDPATSRGILQLLRTISDDGLTVVCSLHQVELATQFADRIVAMRNGAVVLDRPAAGVTVAELHSLYPELGSSE